MVARRVKTKQNCDLKVCPAQKISELRNRLPLSTAGAQAAKSPAIF